MTYLLPEGFSLAQWGAIYTDCDLWTPAVRRIWVNSPALAASTGISYPELIRSGFPGTCAVFIIDDTAVIKFFPPFAHGDFRREQFVLSSLAGSFERLPRLLAAGTLSDRIDWPYLITGYERGRVWREAVAQLSRPDQLSVAAELGHTMRQLHALHLESIGPWPSHETGDAFVQARLQAVPNELVNQTNLNEFVLRQASDLLNSIDWRAARPSLVHADLTEDHVLIGQIDGHWRLSCIIDWADTEVADPSYEWVALWFGFCQRDAGLFRACLSAYDPDIQVEEPFTDRLMAYTLLHRFGSHIIADQLGTGGGKTCRNLRELQALLFAGLS